MKSEERVAFLLSRQHGIGGSDIGSLLSNVVDVEYGCERNLWARLSGVPSDNPDVETEPMTLGTICEPFIRRAYSDLTGRQVEQFGLKKHGSIASLQYHDDGIIKPAPGDARKTDGVLEVKGLGREMMAKVSESGLPADYVYQVQSGMASHGLEWGAFAVGVREDLLPLIAIELTALLAGEPMPKLPRRPKIVHFEVERNEDIITAIEDKAPKFWATIGIEAKAPPRMAPDDPRCGRCVRKIWCQGAALMDSIGEEHGIPSRPDLMPLVEEYQTNSALLLQCEELVKETEDKFKLALGAIPAVKVLIGDKWKNIIYRLRKGSRRVDGAGMAVQYDALRRAAIAAAVPGADGTPPSSEFEKDGAPSRPLRLSALLPKKPKKKGEVSEDEEDIEGQR